MNEERNNQPQAAEPSLSEILQVRRDKLKALQDAGRNPFEQTRFARSAYSADIKEDFEAYDGKTLQAAGRIMSKRGMARPSSATFRTTAGRSSSTSARTPCPSRSLPISASMTSATSSA